MHGACVSIDKIEKWNCMIGFRTIPWGSPVNSYSSFPQMQEPDGIFVVSACKAQQNRVVSFLSVVEVSEASKNLRTKKLKASPF